MKAWNAGYKPGYLVEKITRVSMEIYKEVKNYEIKKSVIPV